MNISDDFNSEYENIDKHDKFYFFFLIIILIMFLFVSILDSRHFKLKYKKSSCPQINKTDTTINVIDTFEFKTWKEKK